MDMDILDDMGVSKSSANVFLKVNYSFNSYSIVTQITKTLENIHLQFNSPDDIPQQKYNHFTKREISFPGFPKKQRSSQKAMI